MDASNTTVILGPPGVGKTTRLLNIVEEALLSGTKPNKIGFISFTKKAAEEGRDRASARFSISPDDLPHFRTLHSFAFKHVGMRRDQVLGWRHIRELGKSLGLEFKGRGDVADDDVYGMNEADRMLFLEGLARNTGKSLKSTWEDASEDSIDWWELERFSNALKAFKKNRGLLDFNDMVDRFCSSDSRTMPQLDLLLVDEAQDNSASQWEAIRLLSSNAKRVFVAGDDMQAIYAWSGADVNQFIGLPGQQTTLEQSYRVPSSVHTLANGLSDRVQNKRSRSWKPRQEAGSVNWFGNIDEVDLSSGKWRLLARNGYMLNALEDYCMTQGFSFTSVNHDPLKSRSLVVIRSWENLRKGLDEPAERVLEVLHHVDPRMAPISLMRKLKSDEPGRMYGMPELRTLGLGTTAIWHSALAKLSPRERDYFIAVRRRGEPLLKEPRMHIGTIHSSKGTECEHTLLLTDVSYRCMVNAQNNPDDEVRVFYVAATRCSQSLNLIMPQTDLHFEM